MQVMARKAVCLVNKGPVDGVVTYFSLICLTISHFARTKQPTKILLTCMTKPIHVTAVIVG